MMSVDHARPIYVAIIGTDALLAAQPAEPLQLTRACLVAGFDLVVPVSWGEELIATHLAKQLARASHDSVVAASCPLVSEALCDAPLRTRVVVTVAPPVATARYVRTVLQPRRVHVTYVGACPGAAHDEIEVHCLPHVLFAKLVDSGIDIAHQPRHLDSHLPLDRARYASLPGGMPEASWLLSQTGVRTLEAAPITVDVVAQLHRDDTLLFDVSRACRCVCARERTAAARIEPPRSPVPVMVQAWVQLSSDLSDEPGQGIPDMPSADSGPPAQENRATFAEHGLSSGDAIPQTDDVRRLSQAREPW